MNKKVCLIDMDLTIADIYTPLVAHLNAEYSLNLQPSKSISYFGDHKILCPDITRKMIDTIFSKDNFFLNLPVIPGAKSALSRLDKYLDIYIVTSPWIYAKSPFKEKYLWLKKHFPKYASKIVATSQKHLIYGDYLIDDHIPFCKKWKEKHSKSIVCSLKYNWTDTSIVDITEDKWKDLAFKILNTLTKE